MRARSIGRAGTAGAQLLEPEDEAGNWPDPLLVSLIWILPPVCRRETLGREVWAFCC
ncbi:hypothetical protein [Azospirillum endophyticum]